MPDFRALLARIAEVLTGHDIPYMIIGGQAVLLHGEPRLTQDVDVTLGLGPRGVPAVLKVCAELGVEPLPEDVPGFVSRTFVLPAAGPGGVRVDFIFSTTAYEAEAIARSQLVDVGDAMVSFATAEDLIIHKLFAGRPRDLEDVLGVIRRSGAELDWDYLAKWAAEFATVPGREHMPDAIAEFRRSEGE